MVLPVRSRQRKFRTGHLRWIVLVPLFVYLYAILRMQRTVVKPTGVEDQLETFHGKEDELIGALQKIKMTDKIGVHNVVNNNVPPKQQAPMKQKLQDKLDKIYLETGRPYDGELWDLSDYAPPWMKEYMTWHKQERQRMNAGNWDTKRILVMQCIKNWDTKCGGTADRLKDFLFLLREAHLTNRFLIIYWTLPARLEEFVVPPQGGLDWRVPDWLRPIIEDPSVGRKIFKSDILVKPDVRELNSTVLRTRVQSTTGLSEKYDPERSPEEDEFDDVYHDVWRMFFTPSQPIRTLVQQEMDQMALVPGQYAAAHLRALYGRITERTDEQATEWTRNAINCATELNPGVPVFFASDHTYSTLAAVEYGIEKHAHIVARRHESLPLHLDAAEHVDTRQAHEFYDTWVDLYLMGMSRCVSFNRGGFGHWGLLIGYDAKCWKNQRTSSEGIGNRCDWTDPMTVVVPAKPSGAPLFLDPLIQGRSDNIGRRQLNETPLSPVENHSKASNETLAASFSSSPNNSVIATPFVEVGSDQPPNISKLPKWMTDYFEWHRRTRKSLNGSNWNETKYMVMSCLKIDKNCGGIGDRLKPLPTVVLQAALSKRLLFIRWHRPKPLEEYLIPPAGGVDWQLPSWLMPHLRYRSTKSKCLQIHDVVDKLRNRPEENVLWLKIQTPDGGEAFYADHPNSESTYAQVFHDLFRKFFTPSPRLAVAINEQMQSHGLVPGQYAAAHFRVMYGNRKWRDPTETINITVNGVNCASNLVHGGPVYFAADVKFAVDAAIAYGKQNSLPVASLEFNDNPSHLDKDEDWHKRNASHYDDTFVDLYMLAESKCVAISNGGYGQFGSLLSHNANCTDYFFKKRRMPKHYRWTYADGTRRRLPLPQIDIPEHLLIKPE